MNTADFDNFDNMTFKKFINPQILEKDLQTLVGILKGIKSDRKITEVEKNQVHAWINTTKLYEHRKPYFDIISLLRESLEDNILTEEECENIIWFCNQVIKKTGYYQVITAGIQRLIGILKGIAIDDEINYDELSYLKDWLDENEYLKNTFPYDEIYNLTLNVILDKKITSEEQSAILNFCNHIAGDSSKVANNEMVHLLKTGFYQIDPDIIIPEKTFCITGISKTYKRREIAEKIELYGGYVVDRISTKLNYLIVCDEKNSCWAFTCHGRKIEQAIGYRKKGSNMVIVHEYDLYDKFESL